jgi:tetratricopeptide (TPR) repeat protein
LDLNPETEDQELPETQARKLAVDGLILRGRDLARKGDIDDAIAEFKRALELKPGLGLTPEKEARKLRAIGLASKIGWLVKFGKIEEAIKAYEEAKKVDPEVNIAQSTLNALCWNGSLQRFENDVFQACERLDQSENGNYRDSLGLAKALTGNFKGAIDDFQFYVKWAKKNQQSEEKIERRRNWIQELEAGKNPFKPATLDTLRSE